MTVKALSIRQPWAWLIVYGHKDVENRDWRYPCKYRGPILVHAGQRFDMDGYEWVQERFPDIDMPYSKGISLAAARHEIDARRAFRYCRLPLTVCAIKALEYVHDRRIGKYDYSDYLSKCQTLGLDLSDTKVSFPKAFKARQQAVRDQCDAIRRRENAVKHAKMNRQLAAIADEWSWLEQKRGAYRFVIPRSVDDFIDEGRAMSNCLREYAAKVARGDIVVAFIRQARQKDKAFVAVAFSPKKGIVTQCYGSNNRRPPDKVRNVVERAFADAEQKERKMAA